MKIWKTMVMVGALAAVTATGLWTASASTDSRGTSYGYGKCSKCSCPGFSGAGYTCTRGGCGHHYDSHG